MLYEILYNVLNKPIFYRHDIFEKRCLLHYRLALPVYVNMICFFESMFFMQYLPVHFGGSSLLSGQSTFPSQYLSNGKQTLLVARHENSETRQAMTVPLITNSNDNTVLQQHWHEGSTFNMVALRSGAPWRLSYEWDYRQLIC